MNINLADSTIHRLQAWVACSNGVTADDVVNQALDCFEQQKIVSPPSSPTDAEAIVNRFRRYRGMLSGVTIDDIVSWRHQGLP